MSRLNVLIVDSSLPHRKTMMASMQDALDAMPDGGRVELAASDADVSQKLASFQPHAILFNFAMSIRRVGGVGFLAWIQQATSAPVVAYGLSEVLRPSALTLGAEAFFLRPTSDDDWPPFASKIVRFLHRLAFEKDANGPVAPLHPESAAPQPAVSGAPGLPRRPLPRFSPAEVFVHTAPAAQSVPPTKPKFNSISVAWANRVPQPTIQTATAPAEAPAIRTRTPEPQQHALSYAEKHFAALARQAAGHHKKAKPEPVHHVALPDLQPKIPLDLIAIGASTGGTDAIAEVLHHLTPPLPPIVIVQHIPSYFSRLFAIRLNEECSIDIEEAADGDPVYPNHAYIAPGGQHMTVVREGSRFVLHCAPGPKVHSVCPSVDVLFDSVADVAGANALGVILTGMGGDGADGLLHMRRKGAETLGQDEQTCVVYGMPRVAYEKGAVAHQLPLQHVAPAILKVAGR